MKFHEYIRSNTKIAFIIVIVLSAIRVIFQREELSKEIAASGMVVVLLGMVIGFFILGFILAMIYNLPSLLLRKRYRQKIEKKATLTTEKRMKKRTERYITLLNQQFRTLPWDYDHGIVAPSDEPTIEWTNEEAAVTLTDLSPRLTSLRQDHFSEERLRQKKEVFARYERLLDSGLIDVERLQAFLRQSDLPEQFKQALIQPRPLVDMLDAMKTRSHEINGQHMALSAGLEGERIVMEELDKYADSYTTLYGTRIAYDERHTVESDALVFSERGIFTVEVKNIKSKGDQSIKISKDGVWYARRSLSEDWQVDEYASKIFDQMNRQVYGSQKFIYDRTGQRLTVHPVIVIANNNAKIENETDWVVIRPNQLYTIISRGPDHHSPETCETLRDLFQTHNLGQKAFKHHDYMKEYDVLLQNTLFISHVINALLVMLTTYNEMEK